MRLLLIADKRPDTSIFELTETNGIDLIITLGDLSYDMIKDLKDITIPKIGVYGNHCRRGYMEELGIIDLHATTYSQDGVSFGGFEGSVRYNQKPHAVMYTQEEMVEQITNFPKVDVVISHCPPYGVHDEPEELNHQGFKIFNKYIAWAKPNFWFHGHTYPQVSESKVGETNVVYVHGFSIVDI